MRELIALYEFLRAPVVRTEGAVATLIAGIVLGAGLVVFAIIKFLIPGE